MSKKQKRSVASVSSNTGRNPIVSVPPAVAGGALSEPPGSAGGQSGQLTSAGGPTKLARYLRAHLAATLIIAFLSIGALGAVLKYLDDDAQKPAGLSGETSFTYRPQRRHYQPPP